MQVRVLPDAPFPREVIGVALYDVEVDVATARPPRVHATAYVRLEASGWIDAELTAIYMVMATRPQVVMPVGTRHRLVAP